MDIRAITNSTNVVGNTYAAKETKQADEVKKYEVTGKTIGQPKLSETAKKYYEKLKSKYQNMDFILVSNDMKEMEKANAGSFANPQKMVVLIDGEKLVLSDKEKSEIKKTADAPFNQMRKRPKKDLQ